MATFQDRMIQIAIDGMLSGAIALGTKLHLFDALAAVGSEEQPATAEQVAEQAKCKTRYVAEWLGAMACGDIIEVTPEEKYYIKKDNVPCVTGAALAIGFSSFLPCNLKGFDKLALVFKNDGGLGLEYSDFCDFYEQMDRLSMVMHRKHLVSDFIPLLGADVAEKLTNGSVHLLDVGCGGGFHAAFLGEHFPKSKFTGVDVTPAAIETAKKRRNEKTDEPLANVDFIQMDAGNMDASWSNKFDVATIFDACHDQQRPDLCLKEIYRVLKPGGVFGMLEVKGSSSVHDDKKELGSFAGMMYATSMFHCLPVGSNSKDALCMGAMWGRKRARQLLSDAGFTDIQVVPTPMFAINVLYVCRK